MLATVHTCYGGLACGIASTISTLVVMFIVVGAIVGLVAEMVKEARAKPCRTTSCTFNAIRQRDYCWQHMPGGSRAAPTAAASSPDTTPGFAHLATEPASQPKAQSSRQAVTTHGLTSVSPQRPTTGVTKIGGRIHFVPKLPSGIYKCQECAFETPDSNAAVYHLVTRAGP
jgi:hypothetical protein